MLREKPSEVFLKNITDCMLQEETLGLPLLIGKIILQLELAQYSYMKVCHGHPVNK